MDRILIKSIQYKYSNTYKEYVLKYVITTVFKKKRKIFLYKITIWLFQTTKINSKVPEYVEYFNHI